MKNILAGHDSQSNINSSCEENYIFDVHRVSININTSNGIYKCTQAGKIIAAKDGQYVVIPGVCYLPKSGKELILSTSYLKYILEWKFVRDSYFITTNDVEFGIELNNGVYISRMTILSFDEIIDALNSKDYQLKSVIERSKKGKRKLG